MSWREEIHNLGDGKFRGIDFKVADVDSTIGRRTTLFEFPGSDIPHVQDHGRATRRIRLNAYVIGDDYMYQRDRLRKAFETPGPGPMIHPYWGPMTVVVDSTVPIRETPLEGGVARFSLVVIEVGDELKLISTPDTAAAVEEASADLNSALIAEFEDSWTVEDFIAAIADFAQDLIDGINGIVSTLNKVKGYVNAAMNIVDEIGDAISSVADAVASLILLPAQLAAQLESIVADIVGAVASISDAWDSYFDSSESAGDVAGTPKTSATAATPASGDTRTEIMMKAFRILNDTGSEWTTVEETTPQRVQQALNQSSIETLMKGFTISETAKGVTKITFASYDQAIAVRDELLDALDILIEEAGDATYGPMVDLRTALVKHLEEASAELPRVITYTPKKTIPALVLAQHFYGDSTRDIEIIDRNNVRDPCRVPGGAELEVLSNE